MKVSQFLDLAQVCRSAGGTAASTAGSMVLLILALGGASTGVASCVVVASAEPGRF